MSRLGTRVLATVIAMNSKTLLIVSALGLVSAARADLLSLWDFNLGSTTGTSPANAALLMEPNGGSLESSSVMSTTTAIANVVSFTGTVTNMVSGDAAGAALALQGGTAEVNNGTSLTFGLSAPTHKGVSDLALSFAGQATATGFNKIQLSASVNGGTYTNIGGTFSLAPSTDTPSFASGTPNPAFIESFNLNSLGFDLNSVNLRLTYAGATSASGNVRLDNLQITGKIDAVPEPTPVAVLGLGALGLLARRRR